MPSSKTLPAAKKATKPATKAEAKPKPKAKKKGDKPSRRPETTIDEAPQITKHQFNVIAHLIRSREPACSAVELVMLGGWRKADAARKLDLSPQSVGNSCARFMDAHLLLSQFYGGVK